MFFWWALLRESAPAPRQAWEPLSGVFISNRGIGFPVPIADPVHPWMLLALVIGIVLAYAVRRWSKRRQALTGAQFPAGLVGAALVLGLPLLAGLTGVTGAAFYRSSYATGVGETPPQPVAFSHAMKARHNESAIFGDMTASDTR